MSVEDLRALLVEVLTRGAPAQQEHAQRLITRLDDRAHEPSASTTSLHALLPDDALLGEALLLVDAFRNDPYLWR